MNRATSRLVARLGGGAPIRRAGHRLQRVVGDVRHARRQAQAPERWTRVSPNSVLMVSPRAIDRFAAERLPEALRGRRDPDDWDLTAVSIDETNLARALRDRFLLGREWQETGLLDPDTGPTIAGLGSRYRTMDPATAQRRFATLDALYASLASDGWRPHYAVGATFDREMAVLVGRDGSLIRNSGGLHRLIMSRLLGLETIPVRVLVEHAELDGIPPSLRAAREL